MRRQAYVVHDGKGLGMKRFLTLAATFALALTLAGCAGNGSLIGEDVNDAGAFQVTADDAAKDAAVMGVESFAVAEGQIVIVSPNLTKGSLQVTLSAGEDDTAIDESVSGAVLSTYEVAPGTYSISVACNEAGTTGTLLVLAMDADEFDQQQDDLDAALAEALAQAEAEEGSAA